MHGDAMRLFVDRLRLRQGKDMRRSKVWLVYQEFQADTPDIVGLFESRRDAERAAEACRRAAREEYDWVVYGDVDPNGDEIADWNVDVHAEEYELQPASHERRRHRRATL